MELTSEKPYLIRAIYNWILDNKCTPHIQVKCYYPNVKVPNEYISNDEIILNISANATKALVIHNDSIKFSSRFFGIEHEIYIPTNAIASIFAAENNRGMTFNVDLPPPNKSKEANAADNQEKKDKPHLKLI